MTSKHTSGPLHVSAVRRTMDGQRWLRVVRSESQREVAYVPFGDRTTDEYAQCMSDAKLYAAAPELLEALKVALEVMENVDGENDCRRGMRAAEAAIAKAEGRS